MNEKAAETYEALVQKARKDWEALNEKPLIIVSSATCGQAAGAQATVKAFQQELANQQVDATIIEAGCMGYCFSEPTVVIHKPGFPPICYGYVSEGVVPVLVKEFLAGDDPCIEFVLAGLEENEIVPTFKDFPRGTIENRIIMQHCGIIDPENIFHYIAHGGYKSLLRALDGPPKQIIHEVQNSGIRGRGGAGFHCGTKWEFCAETNEKIKYVICNADEGDPGAFMDRALLESNPHQVIEGFALAAYAVGASKGYFYIRAEYPLVIKRVTLAIQQARELGFLGDCIMGTGYNLDIEVFQGCGAFVCGEETALIASMEGKAGIPQHRPPFPSQSGLFGKPTVINNVKTLSYIPHIICKGADWFKSVGNSKNPGTAVFALAGKVINTGLAEVPMGTTLRQLIYDVGSGIEGGNLFKGVQIGGPSGGCLPESFLDTPIDFDSLKNAGAMMGSGGMVILDNNDCIVEMARYFLEFTQAESCGKCTFCRLGTKQMLEILTKITTGKGELEDIETLLNLGKSIKIGSLCNLGKTAPNPVLSTIKHFLSEYEAHINEKRCPSLTCKELIAFYILPEKCERSCDACIGSCPVECIFSNEDRIKVIDQDKCVKCNSCLEACPPKYGAIVKISPPNLPIN